MSVIPVIASADDLESAIKFANRNRSARWYVSRRAEAMGQEALIPESWGMVAAFGGNWSDKSREKASEKGYALSDGSFPIKDKSDLKRAIQAFGRAKGDKEKVRKHIIERARALNARDLLPESWHISLSAAALTAALERVVSQGAIEVQEALFNDAYDKGMIVQVGLRDDGAILYDLNPESEEALVAAFIAADETDDEERQGPTHAGLAVQAADTGRVLMLQRALDPEDPVGGKWEFPGGGIGDSDDSPFDAACREFCEETGLGVPDGEVAGTWASPDGVYHGHLLRVPTESEAFSEINPDVEAAHNVENPDDPHREAPEVTAWMHPDEIQGNPAIRPEVLESTDWSLFDPAYDASEDLDGSDSEEAEEYPEADLDGVDSEDAEDEEYEVAKKYRPIVADATGLHAFDTDYPDEFRGVVEVLTMDLPVNSPLVASAMNDWYDHPDSVSPEQAHYFEALVAAAEQADLAPATVMAMKAAQSGLGWATCEQMSEVLQGGYLEDHPTPVLERVRDFLRPYAPVLASALGEYLEPLTAAWNPNLHPRDRDGQFIEVGDIVNVFDGMDFDTPSFQGKVTGNHAGIGGKTMVEVTAPDGGKHLIDPGRIKAAPEHKASLDGPDSSAPGSPHDNGPLPKTGDVIKDHRGRDVKVGKVEPANAGGTVHNVHAEDGSLIKRVNTPQEMNGTKGPAYPEPTPGVSEADKQALRDRVKASNNYQRVQEHSSEEPFRKSRDLRVENLKDKSPEEQQRQLDMADKVARSYAKVYGENDPITVRAMTERDAIEKMMKGDGGGAPAVITNPDPNPDASVAEQLSGHTNQRLKLMSKDTNLREIDRQNAQKELDRRQASHPDFPEPKNQKDKIGRPLKKGDTVVNGSERGTVIGQTPDRRSQVMVRKEDGSIQSWYSDRLMLSNRPDSGGDQAPKA